MMARPDIELGGVVKAYHGHRAVDGVSFGVERGTILSLLGPSGCGKTTVMRMIAGLVRPDAGEIAIKGQPVTRVPVHRRNVGMLFQNYALFPHLDVGGNVAFGLEMRGVAKADVARKVIDALALVKLDKLAGRMPHQLSGGQQQRVALARALVVEPSVLLLDEPFGALDKQLREAMQVETRLLQRRLGITTLMVTHDQEEALTLSDEVAVMRGGRIEQLASPTAIYQSPTSAFVAGFIGTSNFLRGRIVLRQGDRALMESDDGIRVTVASAAAVGERLTVALRPEAIRLDLAGTTGSGPNRVATTIDQVIYRGLTTHVYLKRAGGEPLTAIRQNDDGAILAGLVPGAAVEAWWPDERNHVVAEDPA
ncbi:ABC transporter ATP-binding protein [Siculibacillus lacustris]|uniref:ABC transporter ATP-binding protein n=2 Tax=Siculibacillus lacustris TaxID=1549641 RepID=A0A4V2KUA8_9HYPH|nr:ABC transporter ATP-binding protein [Siculibacillus lacustris]